MGQEVTQRLAVADDDKAQIEVQAAIAEEELNGLRARAAAADAATESAATALAALTNEHTALVAAKAAVDEQLSAVLAQEAARADEVARLRTVIAEDGVALAEKTVEAVEAAARGDAQAATLTAQLEDMCEHQVRPLPGDGRETPLVSFAHTRAVFLFTLALCFSCAVRQAALSGQIAELLGLLQAAGEAMGAKEEELLGEKKQAAAAALAAACAGEALEQAESAASAAAEAACQELDKERAAHAETVSALEAVAAALGLRLEQAERARGALEATHRAAADALAAEVATLQVRQGDRTMTPTPTPTRGLHQLLTTNLCPPAHRRGKSRPRAAASQRSR